MEQPQTKQEAAHSQQVKDLEQKIENAYKKINAGELREAKDRLSSDDKFWLGINGFVALIIISLIWGLVFYYDSKNDYISNMIVEENIDPIAARCAYEGMGNNGDTICAVYTTLEQK